MDQELALLVLAQHHVGLDVLAQFAQECLGLVLELIVAAAGRVEDAVVMMREDIDNEEQAQEGHIHSRCG